MYLPCQNKSFKIKIKRIGKNFIISLYVPLAVSAVQSNIERSENALADAAEACGECVRYIKTKGSQVFKTALFYYIKCH